MFLQKFEGNKHYESQKKKKDGKVVESLNKLCYNKSSRVLLIYPTSFNIAKHNFDFGLEVDPRSSRP